MDVCTYLFNVDICIYVDIFITVFYLRYYCNIRYVVLSFDEINIHYYYYLLLISINKFSEFFRPAVKQQHN